MRFWEKLVSVAAIAVIVAGGNYAIERESFRDSLDAHFERINVEYFDGQVANVRLRWAYLPDDYGQSSSDGEIIIDTASVRTEAQLEETLEHEMCHQAVGVEHEHDDVWQACMMRFSKGNP